MKNVFGNAITVTLFGESHGKAIGAVLDGVCPGIAIDYEYINEKLAMRRPSGEISTARVEPDKYEIISGVYNGYTTGTPLTVLIENSNTMSSDYSELEKKPRPGHADYTAEVKYHGYQDPRGGGHFSGRVTAALVAIGAILSSALKSKGIRIGSHISSLGSSKDRCFGVIADDLECLEKMAFPVLSKDAESEMRSEILAAAKDGDSIGGVLETAIIGLPTGIGEPWFDSVESRLSHIIFSVPGVKGIEFGDGFALSGMRGSAANDRFAIVNGKVATTTNHNGGINGGITNGMPVIIRSAIKPTPSIHKEQTTVNLATMTEEVINIKGRHDPCIVHRVRAVIDAVAAIAIADMITERYGTDALSEDFLL